MSIRLHGIVLFCLCSAVPAFAQVFTELPRHLQLYPRGADDSAIVPISGSVSTPGYDSIVVQVLRNNTICRYLSMPLSYDQGSAPFAFAPKIRAELAEYAFVVRAKNATTNDLLAASDSIVAGDVYLIAGQSNAVLCRKDVKWTNEFCRTFGNYYSGFAADTNWALSVADTNARNPAVGVWVLLLQKKLVDAYGIPTCVINGAVGGRTIESMLRYDSDPTRLSSIYGMMLYRARKSGLAEYAKAMFWYQGESNAGSSYSSSFSLLYNAWKQDYPRLEKVYVFQIRPGCNINRSHAELREIQRNFSKKYSDIRTISTMGIPFHDGCHFLTPGYEIVAQRVFDLLARDFRGSSDTASLDGPNIAKAFYTTQFRTEIALVFSPSISMLAVTDDTVVNDVKRTLNDYFFLDDSSAQALMLRLSGDTLFLTLKAPSTATRINYLPDKYYDRTQAIYEGPWLLNERGIGAFSFWHVPIEGPAKVFRSEVMLADNTFAVYPNPASMYATLIFSLEHAERVRIELLDLLGRTRAQILDESFGAGTYTIPFDIEPSYDKIMIARLLTSGPSQSVRIVTGR